MTEGSAGVGATLRAGLSDVGGAVRDCWGALALAAMLSMTAPHPSETAQTSIGSLHFCMKVRAAAGFGSKNIRPAKPIAR